MSSKSRTPVVPAYELKLVHADAPPSLKDRYPVRLAQLSDAYDFTWIQWFNRKHDRFSIEQLAGTEALVPSLKEHLLASGLKAIVALKSFGLQPSEDKSVVSQIPSLKKYVRTFRAELASLESDVTKAIILTAFAPKQVKATALYAILEGYEPTVKELEAALVEFNTLLRKLNPVHASFAPLVVPILSDSGWSALMSVAKKWLQNRVLDLSLLYSYVLPEDARRQHAVELERSGIELDNFPLYEAAPDFQAEVPVSLLLTVKVSRRKGIYTTESKVSGEIQFSKVVMPSGMPALADKAAPAVLDSGALFTEVKSALGAAVDAEGARINAELLKNSPDLALKQKLETLSSTEKAEILRLAALLSSAP